MPQFPYCPHKVSVNYYELGYHLEQCLAQSEFCVNVLILKPEVFKYEHIIQNISKYIFLFFSTISLWITSI